jgi:hypothetical protein
VDALRFQKSQGKQRVTDLHGQGFTPARPATQHLQWLSRNKTQLTEASQRGFTDIGRRRFHARNQRMGSIGQL